MPVSTDFNHRRHPEVSPSRRRPAGPQARRPAGPQADGDLFVPQLTLDEPIMRLVDGTRLVPIGQSGVTPFAFGDFVSTPSGEIYATSWGRDGAWLLRFDPAADHFATVSPDGSSDPIPARTISWSTPMQALLVAEGGHGDDPHRASVSTFANGTLTRIGGLSGEGWITNITNFPDHNLTVMITEDDHTVYTIDATQTLTRVGDLGLYRPRSISGVTFLPDPPRLAIATHNTNHLFQMRLTQTDGIWRPADGPISGDVLAILEPNNTIRGFFRRTVFDAVSSTYLTYGFRFENGLHRWRTRRSETVRQNALGLYRVAGQGLVQIDATDPAVLTSLPPWLHYQIEGATLPVPTAGLSAGLTLILDLDDLHVRDASGELYEIENLETLEAALTAQAGTGRVYPDRVLPFSNRADALFSVGVQVFLLHDRTNAEVYSCQSGR
uniref:Uncharacterized protein n=2 Tax=Gymnodinialimonas phycosphaerae TaxID=2841589 RepID=A0A975YE62_9RHOB